MWLWKNMNQHNAPERYIQPEAFSRLLDVLRHRFPDAQSALLVCDENTWLAAGEITHACVSQHCNVTLHSLGRSAKPLLLCAQDLCEQAARHDVLLALGSGTINDIVKYAAHTTSKPYIAIATAASMNGYSSANASLIEEGIKTSFAATPPIAVVADLDILAAAPRRMMRAGFADALCRSTVEADCILSHYFLGTPYPASHFEALRQREPQLYADANAAREGNHDFLSALMHCLLDGGDAMTAVGSSAIASQGEHMIAHTIELMYGAELHGVLHGELIALATVTMSRLQQKMLLGLPQLRTLNRDEKLFLRYFGKKQAAELMHRYENKLLTAERMSALSASLPSIWSDIKLRHSEVCVAPNTIERVFRQIGLSIESKDFGLDEERYRNACTNAYLSRDRFTFLDLAVMNDKRIT